MKRIYNEISLTYIVGGESNVATFVGTNALKAVIASIKTQNLSMDDALRLHKVQAVKLQSAFVENALKYPPEGFEPHSYEKARIKKWQRLDDAVKIDKHIEQYCSDLGAEFFSY